MNSLEYDRYTICDRYTKNTVRISYGELSEAQFHCHQKVIESVIDEKICAYKELKYITDEARIESLLSMAEYIEDFIRHGLDRYPHCVVKPMCRLEQGSNRNYTLFDRSSRANINFTCEFLVLDKHHMVGGHLWQMKSKTWYPDDNLSWRLPNSNYTIKTLRLKEFFESLVSRIKMELL